LPESFFADMNTSNLATATSLDRPTELNFMERQEVWVEDLTVLGMYQIRKAKGAVNSGYREALMAAGRNNAAIAKLRIVETPRTKGENGRWVYEASQVNANEITIQVDFPAIIEADIPARIAAITGAMTLGSKMGTVIGIDEREGVKLLFQELGVDDVEELLDKMYPESTYDPDRTKEPPEPAVVPGTPGVPGAPQPVQANEGLTQLRNAIQRLNRAHRLYEARREGQAA
jgi:hypothetical protein